VTVVVNFNDELEARKAPSLDRLGDLTIADMAGVNKVILEQMQSPVLLIPQLAGHIIAAGGKRLRPMLTLSSARLCDYKGERHVSLAACVEFIHTATLLHDDVVDESDLRRGAATANAVWGNKSSVLVGDFLFSRAFELMVADGSLEVLRILSRASSVIAEGEVHQLVTANDTDTTEEDYLEVIEAKTAKLFAAATEIGAVVSDRPTEERLALESFGHNIGMAFQLIDDVLDYSAQSDQLGKNVGDDLAEGKPTLPLIRALQTGNDAQQALIREAIKDGSNRNFEAVSKAIEETGALKHTLDQAQTQAVLAKQAIANLNDNIYRQALNYLADYAVERRF